MKPQHGNLQTLSLEATKVWSPPVSPWDPPCFTFVCWGNTEAWLALPSGTLIQLWLRLMRTRQLK